ncbi:MAG: glycoside hydrolase family 172 protein, partial [Planctomycetota bacterium]
MNRKKAFWGFGAILAALGMGVAMSGSAAGTESETVTLKSLLEEMVDRDRIARLPSPAYTCKQASSYDRNSTEPGSPTWWANADRSYFVRVEENQGRKEHVLMDVDGPGAVVRFWATWHGPGGGEFSNGTMRVYLDGEAEPVIEGPMADLISGGALVGEPLSHSVSPETAYRHRGHNLYLPIPYAKHCKITYETDVLMDLGARKGEALYYQINYRTYEPETSVESFSTAVLKEADPILGRVQKMLKDNERPTPGYAVEGKLEGRVLPFQGRTLTIKGEKAIRIMQFQLKADDLAQALRSTVIKISFDGRPAVWCPIGDFFGTGYHIRPHATWYTDVAKDGTLSCYWTMPFRKRAEILIANLGSQTVELKQGRVISTPWAWDQRSCHFHAAWKQWAGIETQSNEKAHDHGAFDLNWITVNGQGTYVGDVLTLFNTANTWWGEGDEKIYVDGESFPSHIGTGTEDYYGYAWCKPEFFESAFHAQPSGDGNLVPGFTVNSRYRALDAIPFGKSIQFDMELWHWAKTTMDYAPATFWYARPGATWDVKPNPKEAKRRVPRAVEDIIKPRRVKGALEGETLSVVERTGGVTEIQNLPQFGWSNNRQLWWRNAKEQDRLVVEFAVEEAGDYDVRLGITKARDYGIVRLAVNAETKIDKADFYNPSVVAEDVKLPSCRLRAGKNTLEVTILGANPAAVKSRMFGLD